MKTFLLLLFISLNAFGMEVKIRCDQLDGTAGCKMAYQKANFLDVNNRDVTFEHGPRCYENSCDWIGQISPNVLYEGSNHAEFEVMTLSNDPKIFTKHKYGFYFGGHFKDSFISTRHGYEVDQTSISFDLSLEEIDPALYNEYIELRDQYESSVGRGQNPAKRYEELEKSLAEINKRIKELTDLANSIKDKQFDEIDADTLSKLGIAENQIKLLKARKEELLQYSAQTDQTREQVQTQIIARYEAVRARAKTYDSNLPDLPIKPNTVDASQFKISSFVQELNNELVSILSNIESAISEKNFTKYSEALKDWKRASDHTIGIYTQGADINAAEKELLYHTVYDGSLKIFKDGVSNDGWRKTNSIPENIRKTIDALATEGYEEASNLRNTLNFQKINPSIETDVKLALAKTEQLSNKLNGYDAKTETQKNVKNIASAALKVSLSSIDDAIQSGSKEPLAFSEQATEIGLMVLDIGIDLIPGVSNARSAVELFLGKNIVTGEEYTKLDYSMAFVGLFLGLGGKNLAKVAFEPATELVSKIGKKLKLPWTSTAAKVRENLPQVDNLISYYKRLKKPVAELLTSDVVNTYLMKKFARFTNPPFIGPVLKRISEAGEEYCRIVTKSTLDTFGVVHKQGGVFVFRCQDILKKTVEEIVEMGAIPDFKLTDRIFIAQILPPVRTETYEGIAAAMDGKKGGAIQVLLDIIDKKVLDSFDNATLKEVKDVFTGF